MRHNVIMPKLGESVMEGTIVKWFVKPGDRINQYDNLLEVETDKVVAEVPATEGGIVQELLFQEGDTVKVGTVICILEGEAGTGATQTMDATPQEDASTSIQQENTNNRPATQEASSLATNNSNISNQASLNNRPAGRYSPAVLTLAQEHNIDLTQVQGTGFEGRITRKDILAFISSPTRQSASDTSSSNIQQAPTDNNRAETTERIVETDTPAVRQTSSTPSVAISSGDTQIPVTPIRRSIARKMMESVSNIPHAWMTIEVDATELVNLRDQMKASFLSKEGYPITYFAFFVVEIVKALKDHPLINSVWQEDHILLKKDINVSIAVAVDNSLFVPVIRNADTKNVKGIAREIFELASKAKSNSLTVQDMQGGTFTINNTGSFGSISSMGIINYPQAAILQIEAIVKRPVVLRDNMIALRHMVNLSLSIDHRVMDGLAAGNFLKQVKYNIEHINRNSI